MKQKLVFDSLKESPGHVSVVKYDCAAEETATYIVSARRAFRVPAAVVKFARAVEVVPEQVVAV